MGRPKPPLYVNSVGIEGSPFDVVLDFRRRPRQAGPDADSAATEFGDGVPVTSVVMGWEHAKLLHHILGQVIDQVEDVRGEVPLMLEAIRTEQGENRDDDKG